MQLKIKIKEGINKSRVLAENLVYGSTRRKIDFMSGCNVITLAFMSVKN